MRNTMILQTYTKENNQLSSSLLYSPGETYLYILYIYIYMNYISLPSLLNKLLLF